MKGRIVWEPNITDEQKDKVISHYALEKIEELKWAHSHPLWNLVKEWVEYSREDILKQIKKYE